jgi:hypothetical protein
VGAADAGPGEGVSLRCAETVLLGATHHTARPRGQFRPLLTPILSTFEGYLQSDTIGIQNILQVSTANNWQGIQLGRTHTLQGEMKRVVHVDVREIAWVDKLK